MFRIGKNFRFEAGHHLPHLPEGHKCRRPHGHSYQVEVVIWTDNLDADYFVLDYGLLDGFKKWIDNTVDHQDLNQIMPKSLEATTAENLAYWFWNEVRSQLVKLVPVQRYRRLKVAVKVKETESTFAEYSE